MAWSRSVWNDGGKQAFYLTRVGESVTSSMVLFLLFFVLSVMGDEMADVVGVILI